jgi:outer membrane protein insertion porin family
MSWISSAARSAAILTLAAVSARAQGAQGQDADIARCATPDTVMSRGSVRTAPAMVVSHANITPGVRIPSYAVFPRAIKAIFDTGEFDHVTIECKLLPDGKAALVFVVDERPVLREVGVSGVKTQSQRTVEERVELLIGRPVDPALVARAISRIDSLYQANGYNLVKIFPDTTVIDSVGIEIDFRVRQLLRG